MIVGVVGGGQLGCMIGIAGVPLGLRFRFLDPNADAPAGRVGELIVGGFHDHEAVERFADGVGLFTYEFENVPVDVIRRLGARAPIYPPPEALEAASDRLSEKTLFQRLGIPTPEFAPVESLADLADAVERISLPAVLKRRRFGYDGKGQLVLRAPDDSRRAWEALGGAPLLLERFIRFDREISIIAVRGRDGDVAFYPLVENHHRDGVLRLSVAPAPRLADGLAEEAEHHAGHVLKSLDYVGVLAIEFFECQGRLIANEMAPRVHNSGHWTIEGAVTSQFENHLRAALGLPLGSTALVGGHSAMLNLIGTLPDTRAVLSVPDAHLHLYGKAPEPRRKLGHITVRADALPTLDERISRLRALIR